MLSTERLCLLTVQILLPVGKTPKSYLATFFPIMGWITSYNVKANLVTGMSRLGAPGSAEARCEPRVFPLADIIAGLSVGAMIVPQSIAYAGIAKLPAYIGLFSAMVPVYMYAIFGTCKEMAPGPTALNAIMTGSVLPPFISGLPNNPNNPTTDAEKAAQNQYNMLAVQTALVCGILYIIIGVLRLGFLTSFLSSSVTSGFTTAAGIFIITSQFKYLSGIKVKKACSTVIEVGGRLGLGELLKRPWRPGRTRTSCSVPSRFFRFLNPSTAVRHRLLGAPGPFQLEVVRDRVLAVRLAHPDEEARWEVQVSRTRGWGETYRGRPVSLFCGLQGAGGKPSDMPFPLPHRKLKMLKALGPLIIAVTGIVLSAAFKFEKNGIRTVKQLPPGLPHPTFHAWDEIPNWNQAFSIAWAITFIGLIEGVSTARTLATKLK